VSGEDLRHKLDQLHEAAIDAITDKLRAQVDEDGNPMPPSNDDLRVALQLLKQNNVTAPAIPDSPTALMARMAGKLDFVTLQRRMESRGALMPSSADAVRPRMPSQAAADGIPSPENQ